MHTHDATAEGGLRSRIVAGTVSISDKSLSADPTSFHQLTEARAADAQVGGRIPLQQGPGQQQVELGVIGRDGSIDASLSLDSPPPNPESVAESLSACGDLHAPRISCL